jgi:hypothetical protein
VYIVELKYTKGNGYEDLDQEEKDAMDELFEACERDWKKFVNEPKWMVDALNEKAKAIT